MSLKYSEYVDNAYFCGLSLYDAGRLAARYPDLQIMADIQSAPEDPIAFVREVQNLRLFGVRGTPDALNEPLCNEALRCGLFLASTDSSDPDELRRMLSYGVNFIETSRPDLAAPLLFDAQDNQTKTAEEDEAPDTEHDTEETEETTEASEAALEPTEEAPVSEDKH